MTGFTAHVFVDPIIRQVVGLRPTPDTSGVTRHAFCLLSHLSGKGLNGVAVWVIGMAVCVTRFTDLSTHRLLIWKNQQRPLKGPIFEGP